MRQIVPPIPIVQKILGAQSMVDGSSYRLSTHCMRAERPEGILLYHTLTGELLLLSHEEAALLGKFPGSVVFPELEELAARWFLRPLGTDDMALADQTRQIGSRFQKKENVLTGYTIFTTTACNARCFYCFETGWKKSSMSEQTALDTAKYIMEHCGGRPVRFRWFGGEPLVNAKAIDVITDFLRRQGVEFRSTMISNGYLFDEMLVQRARDIWNLKHVQITLDGTEEIYNTRKAYVHPEGSPFQRVMGNIGLLLDADIRVQVRLNMDVDNEKDLYDLVDELTERFGGRFGFGIYLAVIFENAGTNPSYYTEEERRAYTRKLRSMQTYMEEKGVTARTPLRRKIAINSCIADNGSFTTVTPEGLLGRCEGCMNGSVWGSIYSDEVDTEALRQWREHKPAEEICKTCAIYPQCFRLKKCPDWREHCSPIERRVREDRLRRGVLGLESRRSGLTGGPS